MQAVGGELANQPVQQGRHLGQAPAAAGGTVLERDPTGSR